MISSGNARRNRLVAVAETGILVATALALAAFKLYEMPNGGSVSAGMLPLLLAAARLGPAAGALGGVAYGLLSVIRRPFIVHPLQFVFDYPLAFAAAGLAGLWEWRSPGAAAAAALLALSARLVCHTLAGAVFFASPGDPWRAALIGSLAYNAAYLVPEGLLCAVTAGYLTRRHPALVARH